ncbi:hypothetical protein [Nocardiopsis sp. FIRDI 009]|uniref:hypothetical protein n=1 Tax=Nocardiopsis sp. FIRDI 009 TaxID=714197 RepID=UPI000E2827A9|nr:hypothetical protein [Nocardiopsis sp. FIRDI 009]
MSLVLILFGAVLVSLALFNKVPRYAASRIRLVSARLTEQGRALCTAVGGSALIVAFFLTLSGL